MSDSSYIEILHSLFEKNFLEAYRDSNVKKRRKVLPYLQAIHRRWYYATLVEHTPFSPANLVEGIARHCGGSVDESPVVILRTPSKVSGVDMKMLSYDSQDHPAVRDMRTMMEYCTPHIDLYEVGCFTDAQAMECAELLTLNDPHYASFLLELAVWLKWLQKMPSLYVQRVQPSKKAAEALAHSNEEILRDIVNAAIAMTACGLRNSIPAPEHIFTESFVRSLLLEPMETDDIFARVFDVMGYDLDDLLDDANMPMPDGMSAEHMGYDMELLSGTFVMGIVLDRFFFTPFGHFLRIIRPLYALPFSLHEEIGDYVNVCEDPEEAFVAFFAPCSGYTLTDLGLKLMDVKPTPENYFDVAELDFAKMKDTIFASEHALATFVELAAQLSPLMMGGGIPDEVYNFKVKLESDASMWIQLLVPDNFSLFCLYEEIAEIFDLKSNADFSFFHDKVENRFAEYPSEKRADKTKTPKTPAEDCILSDLDLEHMNHLILAAYNQGAPFSGEPSTTRLHIERLSVEKPDVREVYPHVSKMSRKLKAQLS